MESSANNSLQTNAFKREDFAVSLRKKKKQEIFHTVFIGATFQHGILP